MLTAWERFWEQIITISTPAFQTRFLAAYKEYLNGTAEQAEDRDTSRDRDVESYLEVRRRTIEVLPSFTILDMGVELPDEVVNNSTIEKLRNIAVDMTIIANVGLTYVLRDICDILISSETQDILSYNKEQASGDDEHNLVTILMKNEKEDVQKAIDRAADMHAKRTEEFNRLYLEICRWGDDLGLQAQSYVNGMAQWVIANVQWSYETERYFGKGGLQVKKTRQMRLLPKTVQEGEIGLVVVDEALL
jgi:hypothetical protein